MYPTQGKILPIIVSTLASGLLLTGLLLLLGSAPAQAATAPRADLPDATLSPRQTYTPAITITLPSANEVITTADLPTYTVQAMYSCGTLCVGSALLDVVSVTVNGGVTYHEAISDGVSGRYVYAWPLSTTEDYVPHKLIALARNGWGNIGASNPITTYVDVIPPQEPTITSPTYTENTTFTVSWSAHDGSGVVKYDLQYRRDDQTAWTGWLTDSDATSQVFTVTAQELGEGHDYTFRMMARDSGHNRSDWVAAPTRVGRYSIHLPLVLRRYPPPIVENGGFETGDFAYWQHGGELDQSVGSARPHQGAYSALLGNPSYPNSNVPEGSAWVYQTIEVPTHGTPILSFWYRIFTYDVMWSNYYQCHYDYFDVYIQDANGQTLERILRDGYTGPWEENKLQDLGWRYFSRDLSAYAGQTIRITFANFNTPGTTGDPGLNTYTYLDDVAVTRNP